ncbi:hypothetical protein ACFQGT_08520 [Natrialbaceae archaeon GCM10025810]|uniref:hypothetical protein n=1 Tax=Halovalidus salilacus TaxID=3075124 RepID=UPI00360A2039
MDSSRLKPVYLFGIALNAIALAYALWSGSTLYAATFGLVVVYLAVRYRMLSSAGS